MHCNVRPMTAADLATTAETWPEQRDEELESVLETLLEVCVLSSHAWTATDPSDRPLAFMGAVPIPGVPDTGHVWLVVLGLAGAVFIGRHTPEVIGDYVGGSNHVLPTARSARFSSGLSVLDFVKRTSVLKLGPDQLKALAPAAITLAKAEGLDAHARSVAIRLNM